jgi:hypothetical protein
MSRARDTADVQDNVGGAVAPYVAGKNKIINGDFGVWQRGTTFSSGFTADRWITSADVGITLSQQTFTPGTAPVVGYEGSYFARFVRTAGGGYGVGSYQKVEDVRVLAGQTVTLSFWAKADSAIAITPYYNQLFGTGGSATVGNAIGTVTLSTSWARYSLTFSMPSMSGKTIGTNSFTEIYVTRYIGSAAVTIDLWGVQLEAGSVATPFTTASGSIGGELALCQRYYYLAASGAGTNICMAAAYSTNTAYGVLPFKVSMRTAPTAEQTTGTNYFNLLGGFTADGFDSFSGITAASTESVRLDLASGISSTQLGAYWFTVNNASARLAFSAEL